MSAVNTINISAITPTPKPIQESVIVGKDILDLLAGSMYIDPLIIYREYIQNAADSIDLARNNRCSFDEPPGVQILFDHPERSVRIRDNGLSIPFSEFVQRIITIGASQKRGQNLRGFRGVGRLSGLGYCQELIFRGRAEGNAKVTEVRWNGRALKEKYRDEKYAGTLEDIVKEVTTVSLLSSQGFPNRFFEVELRKVARLNNDILLNEEVVRNYLSQVAPVPFSKELLDFNDLQTRLESYGIKSPISIELMDGKGPIYHRLNTQISLSDQLTDKVKEVDFFEIEGVDGEICACGWIAHHSYLGSIPKRLGLGGVRLRSGNIQVGDDSIVSNLFPEVRFSAWAIGDIHILTPKMLPNGRRDNFEPSAAYSHLQNALTIKAREITQKIRDSSSHRNKLRSVNQKIGVVGSWVDLDVDGNLPTLIREILKDLSEDQFKQARKELDKLDANAPETQQASELLKITETSAKSILSRNVAGTNKTVSSEWKKPITAALKTIITSAKSPAGGIQLSLEVLEVFERALHG